VSNFNDQFIYAIIIIFIGYVLKRSRVIQEKDGEGLSRIIFNLTLPALIISSLSDMKIEYSLFLLVIIAFAYGLGMGALSILIFNREPPKIKGMLTMLVSGLNIGLFAYPLVEGIWGKDGVKYFGMFDIGNSLIVFGLLYLVANYYSFEKTELSVKDIFKKLIKSIPLMTYLTVCLFIVINLPIPEIVLDVTDVISSANTPLSFLLLGVYLHFSYEKGYYKRIFIVILVRYGIGTVIGLSLFYLFPFDDLFNYTMLIGFILPASLTVLPYSIEFNYDQKLVGTTINITILLSFLLLWGIANIFF